MDLIAVESAMRIAGVCEEDRIGIAQQVMLMADVILNEIRKEQARKSAEYQ